MYVTIRKYKLAPGAFDDLARRVREDFVPLIRQARGFADYYWVRLSADAFATISIFEERKQAEASNALAADWIKRNKVGPLFLGGPEVIAGDLTFSERSPLGPPGLAEGQLEQPPLL
jgi:hypothetical protein